MVGSGTHTGLAAMVYRHPPSGQSHPFLPEKKKGAVNITAPSLHIYR